MAALYKSRAWLTRQYLVLKQHPELIAKLCNVDEKTIRRYIEKFGLRR
jgi:hypothetical protein